MQPFSDDLVRALRDAFPIVRGDGVLLDAMVAHGQHRRLEAGQFICMEGDRCGHLAFMLGGTARVFKSSEEGREITLYRIEPGESCILTASCILSERRFPAFAVVDDSVEALLVPAGVFRRWVAEHEAWRQYVFDLLSRRLADVIEIVEEVSFQRLDVRLAAYLAAAVEDAEGAVVRTTHEAIAADLGTSREVVSRLLKELEREGLVGLGRGAVTVRDQAALHGRAAKR